MAVGLDVVGGVAVGADHLIVLPLQDVVNTTAIASSFAHTHELGGTLDGAQGARIIEHVIGARLTHRGTVGRPLLDLLVGGADKELDVANLLIDLMQPVVVVHVIGCMAPRGVARNQGFAFLGVGVVRLDQSRQHVVVVLRVHRKAKANLLQIACAGDGTRLLARLGQRGQQHRRQDRDDGDDNQKLNQGKMPFHVILPNFAYST